MSGEVRAPFFRPVVWSQRVAMLGGTVFTLVAATKALLGESVPLAHQRPPAGVASMLAGLLVVGPFFTLSAVLLLSIVVAIVCLPLSVWRGRGGS